jgi:hypothetical protein
MNLIMISPTFLRTAKVCAKKEFPKNRHHVTWAQEEDLQNSKAIDFESVGLVEALPYRRVSCSLAAKSAFVVVGS